MVFVSDILVSNEESNNKIAVGGKFPLGLRISPSPIYYSCPFKPYF